MAGRRVCRAPCHGVIRARAKEPDFCVPAQPDEPHFGVPAQAGRAKHRRSGAGRNPATHQPAQRPYGGARYAGSSIRWIPAFAGMTGRRVCRAPCHGVSGAAGTTGLRRSGAGRNPVAHQPAQRPYGGARYAGSSIRWIPAFAGMTGVIVPLDFGLRRNDGAACLRASPRRAISSASRTPPPLRPSARAFSPPAACAARHVWHPPPCRAGCCRHRCGRHRRRYR